jgi:hypothetical protein
VIEPEPQDKDLGQKDGHYSQPRKPIPSAAEVEVIKERVATTRIIKKKLGDHERKIASLIKQLETTNTNIKSKDRTIFQQQSLLSRERSRYEMMESRFLAAEVGLF